MESNNSFLIELQIRYSFGQNMLTFFSYFFHKNMGLSVIKLTFWCALKKDSMSLCVLAVRAQLFKTNDVLS